MITWLGVRESLSEDEEHEPRSESRRICGYSRDQRPSGGRNGTKALRQEEKE